eukprot:GSChrysophyteH1.ASY1.ANO1.95.1 assembled CDS
MKRRQYKQRLLRGTGHLIKDLENILADGSMRLEHGNSDGDSNIDILSNHLSFPKALILRMCFDFGTLEEDKGRNKDSMFLVKVAAAVTRKSPRAEDESDYGDNMWAHLASDIIALQQRGFFSFCRMQEVEEEIVKGTKGDDFTEDNFLSWAGALIMRTMMHFDADIEFMQAIDYIFGNRRDNDNERNDMACPNTRKANDIARVDDDGAGANADAGGSDDENGSVNKSPLGESLIEMNITASHVARLIICRSREIFDSVSTCGDDALLDVENLLNLLPFSNPSVPLKQDIDVELLEALRVENKLLSLCRFISEELPSADVVPVQVRMALYLPYAQRNDLLIEEASDECKIDDNSDTKLCLKKLSDRVLSENFRSLVQCLLGGSSETYRELCSQSSAGERNENYRSAANHENHNFLLKMQLEALSRGQSTDNQSTEFNDGYVDGSSTPTPLRKRDIFFGFLRGKLPDMSSQMNDPAGQLKHTAAAAAASAVSIDACVVHKLVLLSHEVPGDRLVLALFGALEGGFSLHTLEKDSTLEQHFVGKFDRRQRPSVFCEGGDLYTRPYGIIALAIIRLSILEYSISASDFQACYVLCYHLLLQVPTLLELASENAICEPDHLKQICEIIYSQVTVVLSVLGDYSSSSHRRDNEQHPSTHSTVSETELGRYFCEDLRSIMCEVFITPGLDESLSFTRIRADTLDVF